MYNWTIKDEGHVDEAIKKEEFNKIIATKFEGLMMKDAAQTLIKKGDCFQDKMWHNSRLEMQMVMMINYYDNLSTT